jgi:diguanylate cyclase (GGDEF)-like protein
MEPVPGTAASIAADLRRNDPLEEAVGSAAASVRAVLRAEGVALIVDRDGRRFEGRSGTLDERARLIPLLDGEVRGRLAVSGHVREEQARTVALLVTLALSARFLEESAEVDALTRVLNRRAFDARLAEEWQRALRGGTPLAAAMIDVDYFKVFNDRRGHQAGDDVLRRVAQAAAASLQRAGDRFARYGGEEFAVVLPHTELAGAIEAAERIRAAVAALGIPHPVGKGGRVTVSVGVAAANPAEGGSTADLIAAADRQLYEAKAAGRNCVAAAGYAPVETPGAAAAQPLTELIGREAETNALASALEEHPLVTLTGPMGVGKTRLALAFAEAYASRFARVAFVDLAGILETVDVSARIKSALGGGAGALIVLDGCEQMAQACSDAVAAAGESTRVLATSRVPLGAPGEFVVRVQPLEKSAARELFERRAELASVLADADDPTTAKLLRRLGGSPLAIELAVARLRTASTEQLLADFGNPSDVQLERPTLTSLLAQAVAALDPTQKTALVAVSAFASSFTAEDAAHVIPIEGIDAAQAESLLSRLAACSLLDAATLGGAKRYRIIDPVRAAAMETAGARVVRERAFAAHLKWCRDRVADFDRAYGTVENQTFLHNVAPLSVEFQTALDRALEDERLISTGMELCLSAVRYWFAAGRVEEARARCDAFLDVAEGQDPVLHTKLLTHAMRTAFANGDLTAMERHARTAERLIGDADRQERAIVLNYLGVAAKFRGEYDAAEAYFREGLGVSTRVGYRRGQAVAEGALGNVAFDVRVDYRVGAEHFRRSSAIFREISDDLNACIMIANAAEALSFGSAREVTEALELAAAAAEELSGYGYAAAQMHALRVQACAAVRSGELVKARLAMREVFAILEPSRIYNLAQMYSAISAIAEAQREDELAAILLGAAEAADAARATPTHPLERRRIEPVERALSLRLGTAFSAAVARGKTLAHPDIAEMVVRFLDRVDAPA